MYRLTLQNNGSLPAGDHVMVRTYKWGDIVGTFVPGAKYEAAWRAERRTQVVAAADGLLESVTPLPDAAPPPTVDDVYEEESVVAADKNCIWNRLITITGTLFEIQNTARRSGLRIPEEIKKFMDSQVTERPEPGPSAPAPPPAQAQAQQPRRWVGVEEEDTPGSAEPDPVRRPAPRVTTQFQRPRPEGRPQSSHAPGTHPGPRGPRTEGHRLPGHAPHHGPPREHTGPRPHGQRSGPGPAFHAQAHPGSAPRRPGPEHGAAGPRPSGPRHSGPRPPFQERAAVMS